LFLNVNQIYYKNFHVNNLNSFPDIIFMSEPVLIALIFADRVITEDNQKKGIIGTFSRFHSPEFPVSFPPWFIYGAVTNITPGKHPLGLTITNRDTQQVIVTINGELESKSPGNPDDVIELILPIMNAVFPKDGKYDVAVVMDGDIIGSRILKIIKLDRAGRT